MTVITPSLPDRKLLLQQCRESVSTQTVPVHHAVGVDTKRVGPQLMRNTLAKGVSTEWLLPVDDDDVLDPDCVEVLLEHSKDADVVYSFYRPEGADWCANRLFSHKKLFRRNFIPVTALIRKSFFEVVGGYRMQPMEDWLLWQHLFLHGARFKCVPEVLWSYRFGDNSFQPAQQAQLAA